MDLPVDLAAWAGCSEVCSAAAPAAASAARWVGRGGGGGTQSRSGGTNYAALASLGMMAFQAYQAWQRSQASSAPQQTPQTANLLAGPEIEEHSHAVLRALIAAAKADGRIDEAEKHLISSEIGKHTDDPQLQQWLDAEVAKPLDPAEVAQSAKAIRPSPPKCTWPA